MSSKLKALAFAFYVVGTLAILPLISNYSQAYLARQLAVFLFNGFFLFCVLNATLRSTSSIVKVLATLLVCFLLIFQLVFFYYWYLYDQYPGLAAVMAIMDTTKEEAGEYLYQTFNPNGMALAILLTIPSFLLLYIRTEDQPSASERIACALVALGMLPVSLSHPSIAANNPVLFLQQTIREAVNEKQFLRANAASLSSNVTASIRSNLTRNTHVVIIGESLSKRHMGLYGYHRRTNPELDNVKGVLTIHNSACTRHGTTALSFLDMFTAKYGGSRASFIQILKNAGYKTTWISNQSEYGYTESFVTIISSQADNRDFLNRRGLEGVSLDEKVIPEFDKYVGLQGNQVIFIHLMGSHTVYSLRYPESFAKFHHCAKGNVGCISDRFNNDTIDSYDNSVLYNDQVVAEIFQRAMRHGVASVTYLSDHGESLGETAKFIGHVENTKLPEIHEIPLLFYLRGGYPVNRNNLIVNLNQNWSSDYLIDTLSDLFLVQHTLFDPRKSLFQKTYVPAQKCY